jgi:hypothetical protein
MKQRSSAQINHYARSDLAAASIAMAQISAVIWSRPCLCRVGPGRLRR